MSVQQQVVDVVLSAEQVSLATRRVARERLTVRREVVSQEVTLTVTVRREVLRVDSGPVDPAHDGPAGEVPVLEVVLSEERPVVTMEVVPYERVRLQVQQVSSTTPVTSVVDREAAELLWDEQPAPGPARTS